MCLYRYVGIYPLIRLGWQWKFLMQLASPDHYKLQQYEHRAHDLAVVQLTHLVQLVTEQELKHKEQTNNK